MINLFSVQPSYLFKGRKPQKWNYECILVKQLTGMQKLKSTLVKYVNQARTEVSMFEYNFLFL
ncbi:unnamed protein product [Paramecium sonneborni]|uniref:Uncharacterized protein n=1 Tax=Paramecium sonneborni TaxID=65129 RepID=A0A8S1QR30_9CILI|nr:unnamed protein product [Paramecium sonneborni]